jgi:hypothetical protein
MKKTLSLFVLSAVCACSPARYAGQGGSIFVSPGEDIADFVNSHTAYSEFLLGPGTYLAGDGHCITRSHIIIRRKGSTDEVRVRDPIQVCGDDNIIDGLCWDANADNDIRRSDPATLALSGSRNIIRNCIFRNFQSKENGYKILSIGRQRTIDGSFINTVANHNTVESCTFDNWGLRDEPKGSLKSSTCIAVGREDDKGKFTGTTIRNNLFINGPYKQYGYNAACKVFNAVLLEKNIFVGGQECLEIKYGNSTIRGNIIHHFSGYNILANRWGKNNLYENNTVYDVEPIDATSSTQGFMIWECGNTVFRNNLIYDCAKIGLIPGKETAKNSLMEYLLIENNSFIDNGGGIHFDRKQGSPRHVIITRNIFYADTDARGFNALLNYDSASLEYYSDNFYYGHIAADGDQAPLVKDPQFFNKAGQDYRISDHSPACGYGAYPCGVKVRSEKDSLNDPAHHIVVYPTKNKWLFHIGLVGLDIIPVSLEIDDMKGTSLLKKSFDDPGLKLIANIDLRANPKPDYIIKIHTVALDIKKYIHIQ